MRGPRSIAGSTGSLKNAAMYSSAASVSALSLNTTTGHAGLASEESYKSHMNKKLQPHPSTRDMVEKYERMCTPPPGRRYLQRGGERAYTRDEATMDRGTFGKKEKERSPLRQSIRNLLSTLKKGATKSGEVIGGIYKHNTGEQNSECPPQVPEKDEPRAAFRRNPTLSSKPNRELPIGRSQLPSCTASQALTTEHGAVDFSGPIWYMSKESGARAGWNLCNGMIKDRKLSVTWFNHMDSNHRLLEVDLGRCIDVRSLTNGDMDQDELALMNEQEETRDLKVLELVSRSRETDKFAVRNFGERAAWITALWDSILLTGRVSGKDSFGSRNRGLAQIVDQVREDTVPVIAPLNITRASNLPIALVQPAAVHDLHQERNLPPLPPQATPRMTLPPLSIPPTPFMSKVNVMPRIESASPSVYSPASPPPPGLPSPATSPSMTDLGRRSVVKQRLAEMQTVEGDRPLYDASSKRTGGSLSPFSPASTTGTGRSGFLSVLTSEEEVEFEEIAKGHVPFEHLRESRFLAGPGTSVEEEHERGVRERPRIERNESNRSELPYANSDDIVGSNQPMIQVKSIQEDLSGIKRQIGRGKDDKTLHQVLDGIDDRSRSTKRTVEDLVRKFESLQSHSNSLPSSPCKETREALKATRVELSKKMDALMERLASMGHPEAENTSSVPEKSIMATKADLGTLKEHIDGILAVHMSSLQHGSSNPSPAELSRRDVDQISKISALIESDNGQRALQVQQQADSVRYLNELNTWLESFVRNGTTQINGLATNVEQLCMELGISQESPGGSILSNIYSILSELKRQTDTSTLQHSVDGLIEIMNTSRQNAIDMPALVGFMERQRQDQETFLRAFTSEISGEIKGERLRFVEAMKEATAINIQMQVDRLKKELARQVVVVAQDIGRLESEKREVETKIANLHAFHANQRENFGEHAPLTVTANRQTYRPLSRQPQYPAYAAYHQSRPLPYPR